MGVNSNMDDFSSSLKAARQRMGLKSAELASLIGVSQATISLLENGKRQPSKDMVNKLNQILEFEDETNFTKVDTFKYPSQSSELNINISNTDVTVMIRSKLSSQIKVDKLNDQELYELDSNIQMESATAVKVIEKFLMDNKVKLQSQILEEIRTNLLKELERLEQQIKETSEVE